ncbi:MAG: hypothetical protein H5T97_08975, partial [Firmicutes bacterium]|nr:hypothetical protein [Bacillota bacterium]
MWAVTRVEQWWVAAAAAALALPAAVWLLLRRRRRSFAAELARRREENPPDGEVRLANLEARVENVLALLYELRDRLTWLENQTSALLSRTAPERSGGWQDEVY